MIEIQPVSENSLRIRFSHHISLDLPPKIQYLCQQLEAELKSKLIDLVPAYTTLLVIYDTDQLNFLDCKNQIEPLLLDWQKTDFNQATQLHQIPVCYDSQLGFDLETLAEQKQQTTEQIIELHCQPTYSVCAIGFSPAFAYLAEVLPDLAAPRHSKPRLKIPAGSVGIADSQTAIYPVESAAGWQILGQTPLDLSLKHPQNLTRFQVGDQVQFDPINSKTFDQLKGGL